VFADVVEAMASHRPYRAALGIDMALEEIEKNKGIIYDDSVAAACLRLFREKGYKLIAQNNGGSLNLPRYGVQLRRSRGIPVWYLKPSCDSGSHRLIF